MSAVQTPNIKPNGATHRVCSNVGFLLESPGTSHLHWGFCGFLRPL